MPPLDCFAALAMTGGKLARLFLGVALGPGRAEGKLYQLPHWHRIGATAGRGCKRRDRRLAVLSLCAPSFRSVSIPRSRGIAHDEFGLEQSDVRRGLTTFVDYSACHEIHGEVGHPHVILRDRG
jgi:hypothetical protein